MRTYLIRLQLILVCLNVIVGGAVAIFVYYEDNAESWIRSAPKSEVSAIVPTQEPSKVPEEIIVKSTATAVQTTTTITIEAKPTSTQTTTPTPTPQAEIEAQTVPTNTPQVSPTPLPIESEIEDGQGQGDDAVENRPPIIEQLLDAIEVDNDSTNNQGYGTLKIPKIKLNSDIENIPIIDSQWEITDLGARVGLLEGTGRIPQTGQSMVFAGHAAYFWPVRGPFADLKKLLPGDEITYMIDGKQYTYAVSRLIFAHPSRVDLILNDDGNQIVLVTCGDVDFSTGLSEDRLIVTADLISVDDIHLSQSN